MPRLVTICALAGALLAGCGGDDAGDPFAYLPEDAPFAVALETDPDGEQFRSIRGILDEFPFGGAVEERLREEFQQSAGGVDFDEDVRPLLGNPFVVGATGTGGFITSSESEQGAPFVAAIQAADQDALDRLIERTNPRELGERAGATVYQADDTVFAVEEDMVVFAGDRRQLNEALDRADGDEHLDEEAFDEGLEGLPASGLARVYVDVRSLLEADRASAEARRVPWVDALRTLGLTVNAEDNSLTVDFRLRTEGELEETDLPVAPGAEAPPVIEREGEVGLGLRDLAHVVRFAERTAQTIDPAGFGDYAQAKQTLDSRLGVSIDDDLIGQLTGAVSASLAVDGGFGVRAELEDPAAFEETLERVAEVLPDFAQGAGLGNVRLSRPSGASDFYELRGDTGGAVFFGVVDELLVVASDAERAEEVAGASPAAVEGAEGAAVLSADAEQLANALLADLGPALGIPEGLGGIGAPFITGPLGELDGSLSSSTDELRGRLRLTLD